MRGKIIRYILTPKSTKLLVVVENGNPKNKKWMRKFVQKSSKWPPFWDFWRPFWNSVGIVWDFFSPENIASSNSLSLKCQIPLTSIKQGIFILPAKFKPYFYTCACKWIGFSQILPHISLSLIRKGLKSKIRRSKYIKFGIKMKEMLPIFKLFE